MAHILKSKVLKPFMRIFYFFLFFSCLKLFSQGYGSDFKIDPIINYYEFSQGKQMIELDYFTAYNEKANKLNFEQPRALNWHSVVGTPPENVYIFRNTHGRIIKKYGNLPPDIKLLSVKKSLKVAKPHHHWTRTIGSHSGSSLISTRFYPYYLIGKQKGYGKGTLGLIDSVGNLVLSKKYDNIWQTRKTFVTSSGNKFEIRSNDLKLKYSTSKYRLQPNNYSEDYIYAYKDNLQGLLDLNGKIFLPVKYTMISGHFNQYGLMEVKGKNHLLGFVNQKGKEVIKCKYQSFGKFTNGVISARKDYKRGFLDTKGNIIIPFKYDHAFWFAEGLARVSIRKGDYYHFGFVDRDGNEVIPLKYSSATDFENAYAWVRTDFPDNRNEIKVYSSYAELKKKEAKGNWVKIDKTGQIVN